VSWGRAETCSVKHERSIATRSETLTTEGLWRPEARRERKTFPFACASPMFEVIGATTIVEIRLWLKSSHWTTRTGDGRFHAVEYNGLYQRLRAKQR
jgi:hypothetical protein